jgi:hypothetical protein
MEALRELLAKFEVEVEGADKLEATNEGLDRGSDHAFDFAGAIKVAGAAIAALGIGALTSKLWDFVEASTSAVDETGKLATTLDISTDAIQKWGHVATTSGGSISDVSSSMRRLSKNLFEAQRTSGPAREAFEKLGVAWEDDQGHLRSLEDVMFDSAVAIGGVTNSSEKLALAQETVGRGALKLIPGFKGTREEMQATLDAMAAKGGLFSEEFIRASEAANDELHFMRNQMEVLKSVLVGALLPAFRWTIDTISGLTAGFSAFLRETDLINRWIKIGTFGALAASIKFLTGGLFGWGVAWRNVGTFILRALRVIAPFLRIALRFVAWALILDDIVTFLMGGDSALGKFLDKIMGAGTAAKVLEFLRGVWDALWVGIDLAVNAVKDFLTQIGLIEEDSKKAGDSFKEGWSPVIKVLSTVLGLVGKLVKGFTELQAVKDLGDLIFRTDDERMNMEARARYYEKKKGRPPGPRAPGGAGSTAYTDNSSTTVNLSGKQTPETVRTATREARRIKGGGRQGAQNAIVRGAT